MRIKALPISLRPALPTSGKMLTMLLALSMLLTLPMLTACDDDDAAAADGSWTVTAIVSANGLGDRSYCDLIYSGLRQSENALDINLQVIVPKSYAEAEQYFDAWLNDDRHTDGHRLLVAASGEYEAYLRTKADRIPDEEKARVLLMESETTDAPYYTLRLPFYGAGYTAGYITPLLHGGDSTAVVLANTNEATITDCYAAFRDGFLDAGGRRLDVFPLADDQTGYSMADSLYHLCFSLRGHYGVVLPIAGGSCQGVLRYTREYPTDFYTIGMDVDQQESSYAVAFSILKHIDRAVLGFITSWRRGEKLERHYSYGLATGYMQVLVADGSRFDHLRQAVEDVRQTAILQEEAYEKRKEK